MLKMSLCPSVPLSLCLLESDLTLARGIRYTLRMKTIYLVRHGQTVWNSERRIQGHLDSPLTPLGERHAEASGRLLQGRGIAQLYCSDLGRAARTAAIVGACLGLSPQPRTQLRECYWGEWEGRIWEDLMEQHGPLMETRQANLYRYRPPEGESYQDGEARVRPLVNELRERHSGETVALVAHSMINRMILKVLLDWSFEEVMEQRQEHHEIIRIDFDGEAPLLQRLVTDEAESDYKID